MDKMLRKELICKVEEVAPRTLRFIGTTEDVDRDSDVILVSGWKLDNYKKNPVFLWAHRYLQPPIGKAVRVVKDKEKKALAFDIEFASAETYPFADTIYQLYKEGFLRATSVGFEAIEYKRREDENGEQLARGYLFEKQELLELSAVPIPANPNALIQAFERGVIPRDHIGDAFKAGLFKECDFKALGIEVDPKALAFETGMAEREFVALAEDICPSTGDYLIRISQSQWEEIAEALLAQKIWAEAVVADSGEPDARDLADEMKDSIAAFEKTHSRFEALMERLEALCAEGALSPPAPPADEPRGGAPVEEKLYSEILGQVKTIQTTIDGEGGSQ